MVFNGISRLGHNLPMFYLNQEQLSQLVQCSTEITSTYFESTRQVLVEDFVSSVRSCL